VSRRRAPRQPWDRLSDGIAAQRVGGASRVFAAAPVSEVNAAVAKALKSVQSTTDRLSNIEVFTLAANGAQTKTLAFLPIDGSENVSLNGLAATKGTDWTRTDMTLSLLSPLDPLTSDVLEIQYDYYSALPSVPAVGYSTPGTFVSGASSYISSGSLTATMPTGIAAGDLLIAYALSSSALSIPTGWTRFITGSGDGYWRLATGSDPAPSFTVGTALAISIAAYRGPTSLGTPVAASGPPTGGTFTCPTTAITPGSRIAILAGATVGVVTTFAPDYPTGTTQRTRSNNAHIATAAGDAVESGSTSTAWALTSSADGVWAVVVELLP
jgi:hypothetical protein